MKTMRLTILLFTILLAPTMLFAQAGHTGSCTCGTWSNLPMSWTILHDEVEYVAAAQAEFTHWNNVATAAVRVRLRSA